MKIPFFNFDKMHRPIKNEMMQAFSGFYDTGWYVLGEGIRKFEKEYSAYNDVNYTITVADGLDALVLALQALDIGPGDEVIVPSNTYIATWLAVTQVGATIVPVEPNENTFNIEAENIKKKITAKTKCIMPVNLYGQPCVLDDIMALANDNNIFVVEDNAQSQGARYKGKKAGSFGHANGVSFYPGKNLGALGEAGAITTNDEALSTKLIALRNYGSHKKYHNKYLGRNARMDELQAWTLSVKLKYLDQWNSRRKEIATIYFEELNNLGSIALPGIATHANSVFHQFVIRIDERDNLQNYLRDKGVGTLIHYPIPPHLQPAYAHLGFETGDFPIAERLAKTMLSLPIYPGLSDENVREVCQLIRTF